MPADRQFVAKLRRLDQPEHQESENQRAESGPDNPAGTG